MERALLDSGVDVVSLECLRPMLLSEVPRPFKRQGWGFEPKYDGWRCLAQVKDGRAAIRTRRGMDTTAWWPEIARGLSMLKGHHIVDGEVCVLDELGRSDFERLQRRARMKRCTEGADPVAFCVFDVLVYEGRDVMKTALRHRKALLGALLGSRPEALLRVTHLENDGEWLYQQAVALGLEGIVAKDLSSTYQPGVRSLQWLKIKRPGAAPSERFHLGSR